MICAKLGEIETSKLSTSLLLCELIDIYTCLNYFFLGPPTLVGNSSSAEKTTIHLSP